MEEEIFYLYKKYERCKKIYDIKIYQKKFDVDLNLYSNYLDNSYKEEIYDIMNINHYIKYNTCNQSIILNLWTSKNKKKRLFHNIINHINLTIYILHFYKKLKNNKLIINIVDLDRTKKLNLDNRILTPKNVNSGVTVKKTNNTNEILIYRREELSRVIVHEIIHALDFDNKHISIHYENEYNIYFGLVGKTININESYVDGCAIYINNIIVNLYKYAHDYNQYRSHLKSNLMKERKHIITLATRILKFYDYSIVNNQLRYKKRRTEYTHVISYYVIKAFLYENFHNFILYLSKNKFALKNINLLLGIINIGKNMYLSHTNLSKIVICNDSLKMSTVCPSLNHDYNINKS